MSGSPKLFSEYVRVIVQGKCQGRLTWRMACATLAPMAKHTSPVTLTDRKRESVLRDLDAHRMTAVQAAQSLGISERQVWRLLAAFRQEGAEAVIHGNRGRAPQQTLPPEMQQRILELAQTTYVGFNQTHFTEKLQTVEKIKVSRPTVWRILQEAGIKSPQRHRRPKHRSRRERRPRAGMLLQIDGSDHDWLEERGPHLTLLGAIDDATGEVVAALFRREEDAHGYMLLLQRIVLRHGIPSGTLCRWAQHFRASTRRQRDDR